MKAKTSDHDIYLLGLSAMLPGYQAAINHLQEKMAWIRRELAAGAPAPLVKRRGRPATVRDHLDEQAPLLAPNNVGNAQKSYWAKMTPQERKAEMARRIKVHQRKAAAARKAEAA